MLHIFNDVEVLLLSLADFFVEKSKEAILKDGRFNVALSGGSSPKKLHELLASDKYHDQVEWQKVFFFFGDERYVPLDDERSNFLMAKNTLFSPLQIADDHVFVYDTSLSPLLAAQEYEDKLKSHFKGACSFDFILLGLGDNSHTASLFPHTSVLHEKSALIKEIFVDEVGMFRLTFTAPLINTAHTVVFLVYGAGKAEAVRHILKDATDVDEYPAQLIKPLTGKLHWFLDEAAAELVR